MKKKMTQTSKTKRSISIRKLIEEKLVLYNICPCDREKRRAGERERVREKC